MRRKIISLCVAFLALLVIWINSHTVQLLPNEMLPYFKENFFADTGSQNGVTAIYLNYRVFDTIFEALLLLISIIGIIHFSSHEGGEHNE